ACDAADHSARPIDQDASRQPLDGKGAPDRTLRIEISSHEFETELGDERPDNLAAPAVLGYRSDSDLVAQVALHPLQRGQLAQARLAPRGPKIDEHELTLELREIDRVAGKIAKRNLRRRLRRRHWDEFAQSDRLARARFDRPATDRQREQQS